MPTPLGCADRARHQQREVAVDEVVDEAQQPGLLAVAVDRQQLTGGDGVVTLAGVGHRFIGPLGPVVDATWSGRIDVDQEGLRLRVHLRVAEHLRGGGQQQPGPVALTTARECGVPMHPFQGVVRMAEAVQARRATGARR